MFNIFNYTVVSRLACREVLAAHAACAAWACFHSQRQWSFCKYIHTQDNIHDGEYAGNPGGQCHILVMMAGPEGALLGAGGMDHGVKVENTGRPGGQSLFWP